MVRHIKSFIGVAAVLLLFACGGQAETQQSVDLIITGGTIYDGAGGEPYVADVAIDEGVIVFVGDATAEGLMAAETIDASGLMVTPGFIDMHSHSAPEEDYARGSLPFLYQGITTVSLGLDGFGTHEIAPLYDRLQRDGVGTNVFSYVGHNHARRAVMGDEDRAPTPAELTAMKGLIREGMEAGAFGMSSGLFYVPGSYSETEEVIELAKVAAEFGGIYDTHDRDLGAAYKGIGYLASIREAIEIGEKSGTRVIFSHFNAQGRPNYGRANEGAALINEARARGLEVAGAQHVYNATQSSLGAYTVPRWASAGGFDAMVARFDDPEVTAHLDVETMEMLEIRGGAEKILIVMAAPQWTGKTLQQVADEMELTVPEAVREIQRAGGAGVMNLELYDDNNTKYLAQQDWMMTGTDGRPPHPDQVRSHPRVYGTFTKKLREYVIEEDLISMPFAIRSMSGLAADFLRLQDRGYIRTGQVADIAVFDRAMIYDAANYETPREFSKGTVHVLVKGQFALKDGVHTGGLFGVAITRP